MCGIMGVFKGISGIAINERRFSNAVNKLDHRGPDCLNVRRVTDGLILGHTRLAIIDLDGRSNQPMELGGRYWIVFNGEIYNYLELRRELEQIGVKFHTSGDTEVVLNAYACWGEKCITRFNGMWAFAIFDKLNNMLFCSRDRFGEKPFYYAFSDGNFIFASEISALLSYQPGLAEPDYNVISNFCRTSVGAQHSQTWFKRIRRLQPGNNLIVTQSLHRIERYWAYPNKSVHRPNFQEACEIYRKLFMDSVAIRMRSDVPLGLTLSSGLDSTSIAYAMQSLSPGAHHCFTASYDPSDDLRPDDGVYALAPAHIDETQGAQETASRLGLRHHIVKTNYSNFIPNLTEIISKMGSGNSSPAIVPLFQLMKVAREHVTVVLEGQGADELLAGYIDSVFLPATLDLARQGRVIEALRGVRAFSRHYKLSYSIKLALRSLSNEVHLISATHQRLSGLDGIYGPALRPYDRIKDYPLLEEPYGNSLLTRTLRRSHSGGLVNLLQYGDTVSMSRSLEARLPFTDHRLVEFVWSLPFDYKVHEGNGKHLHREAMRGIIPDAVLDAKTKLGFLTPIRQQFITSKKYSEDPVDVLLSNRCLDRGLFDAKGLNDLINRHRLGQSDYGLLLFRLLSTELWFRCFIDADLKNKNIQ